MELELELELELLSGRIAYHFGMLSQRIGRE
jgi:hypothetical protein